MKNNLINFAIIVLFVGFQFVGCNMDREEKVDDAKANVEKANQELEAARIEYEKEWQIFKNNIDAKITANEKSIIELKSEILTANEKFKLKYEKEIVELEQKNIELKKKISEYKYDGKDKWEEFKLEVNRDVDIVEKALKDIFTKKD
ncbi:MAG: hypothetical protein WAR79_10785 [Melioribacteraceae bacterium]